MKIRTIDVKRLIQIQNLNMLIFFMSCNTEGHWGVSENVAASKARNIYMYSYSVLPQTQILMNMYCLISKKFLLKSHGLLVNLYVLMIQNI
jgi:hypothetical protein